MVHFIVQGHLYLWYNPMIIGEFAYLRTFLLPCLFTKWIRKRTFYTQKTEVYSLELNWHHLIITWTRICNVLEMWDIVLFSVNWILNTSFPFFFPVYILDIVLLANCRKCFKTQLWTLGKRLIPFFFPFIEMIMFCPRETSIGDLLRVHIWVSICKVCELIFT